METWIEEVGRVSTTRNFKITNDKNVIIGNACSEWAMLDMKTRRVKDLSLLKSITGFASGAKGTIEKPMKIPPVIGELKNTFNVKYSDIDINQHVNSVRYVNWVSDYFSLDTYRSKKLKRFEINYMNELFFSDKVNIYVNEISENDVRFDIKSADNSSCRARIVFETK